MKKKILVFEKDAFIRDVITEVLNDAGYLVHDVSDEQEFLYAIEDFLPEAILLDIISPTPLGTKLCEDIKNHPDYNSIPVIVLSTHPQIEVTKKICADEVLKKPFDIALLLSAVEEQLAA